MLILPDGSRIGAVSGGCLEGELCRRAHWWTSQSPAILKTFDTSTQEDNEGFGLGCGGGIDLLIERLSQPDAADASHPLLAQENVNQSREASAAAVVIHAPEPSGLNVGERFTLAKADTHGEIAAALQHCMHLGYSFLQDFHEGALAGCGVFLESLAPPVQLLICGAGTDAQPVAAQAAALGWSVTVLDGRADFARTSRFPEAKRVMVAKDASVFGELKLDSRTAAIIMSHSFAQDAFFLEALLTRHIGYLGMLGSRRRTLDLLARLGLDIVPAGVHSPAGLDIGAETPEQIALSILSEMQATFAGRRGGALRERDGSIHGRELRGERLDDPEVRPVPMRDCGLR
jgi:xanthine/CO dehydrogenase XdhC/CoxF family maturation factor